MSPRLSLRVVDSLGLSDFLVDQVPKVDTSRPTPPYPRSLTLPLRGARWITRVDSPPRVSPQRPGEVGEGKTLVKMKTKLDIIGISTEGVLY